MGGSGQAMKYGGLAEWLPALEPKRTGNLKYAFSHKAVGNEMRRRGRVAEGDGLLNRYTV